MTIQEYETLTGVTVPQSKETWYEANIRRTEATLSALLGWSLGTGEYWTEIGKSPSECACPDVPAEHLLPADEVEYGYRLFPYNSKDTILAIDPAYAVASVKLVKDGVTYRTLEPSGYMVKYRNDGTAKYIDLKPGCCLCACSVCCCTGRYQLAVDADWIGSGTEPLPDPLLYLWADMVTYEADTTNDIKSQTLGTHSWTRDAKTAPQLDRANSATLNYYAGPNGIAYRSATI